MRVAMDPRITSVSIDETDKKIRATLADGREIAVPVAWFPRLINATPEQRANVLIAPTGRALRWPDVDEDIDVSAFLAMEAIIVFPEGDLLIKDDGSLAQSGERPKTAEIDDAPSRLGGG